MDINYYLIAVGLYLAYFGCVKGQIIGEICHYDSDCQVDHSYCLRQEVCECKENYVSSDNLQYCIATIGAICSSKHDCWSLPNSLCYEENCLCERNFVPDPHNRACKPVSQGLMSSCEFDSQCQHSMGQFSTCIRGQCHCLPNYHFNGECRRRLGLGDRCHNNTECYNGRNQANVTECYGHCRCKHGYRSWEGVCFSTNNFPYSGGIQKSNEKLLIIFAIAITIFFKHDYQIT